jgi:hypothetical protein
MSMELTAHQEIFYNTRNPVEIKEVVDSLLAMERTLKLIPSILEKIFPGTSVDTIEVYIDAVVSGSLREKFLYKLLFGSEAELDLFLEKLRKDLGLDKGNSKKAAFIIGLLIAAVVLYGGIQAFEKAFGKSEPANHIEANHNTIINIGAAELGMTSESLRHLLELALINKDQVAADAVKIIKPAKNDPDSEVIFNDDVNSKIEKTAIHQFPSKTDPNEEVETSVFTTFHNTEVHVRAIDLDNKSRGWSAIIPEISMDRMKMQINGDLNLEDLRARPVFRGDIILVEKLKGNEKKALFYILEKVADKNKFSTQMKLLGSN